MTFSPKKRRGKDFFAKKLEGSQPTWFQGSPTRWPRQGYPWYKSSCHLQNTIYWLVGMNSPGGKLMVIRIDCAKVCMWQLNLYQGYPSQPVGDPWNQVGITTSVPGPSVVIKSSDPFFIKPSTMVFPDIKDKMLKLNLPRIAFFQLHHFSIKG